MADTRGTLIAEEARSIDDEAHDAVRRGAGSPGVHEGPRRSTLGLGVGSAGSGFNRSGVQSNSSEMESKDGVPFPHRQAKAPMIRVI